MDIRLIYLPSGGLAETHGNVVRLTTPSAGALAAHRLMERALAIEDVYDRERTDVVNAPRTLDVDLIVVGDRRSHDDSLRLPHPRSHERAFVLVPWLEIDPEGEIPGKGFVADLLPNLDTSGVVKREDLEIIL